MKKFAKLVMVTGNNNNKYYEMEWDGKSANFNVKYGRVESTAVTKSYPSYEWDTKYNEKIRKGYKDMTHTVVEEVVKDKDRDQKLDKIREAAVENFLSLMKKYTDGLVSKTYTVKAKNVTKKQLDNAQSFIDALKKTKKTDTKGINALLLQLYTEIPRYMSSVKDYLLPNINIDKTIQQEQDNLDAMAASVTIVATPTKKDTKAGKTLLDVLGISMTELNKAPKEMEYLTKQLSASKIKAIYEVNKPEHDKKFNDWMATQKNLQTKILLHGTKCSSVIPILEQGLKIRPAGNYQFSGKVYGEGNYFSEVCDKSLSYTGYDKDRILLVYEVHVGNPFIYNGWYTGNSFSLTYNNLQSRGFDSTFVKAGNGLKNSEIIAYKEAQCHIKYIIHYS